MENLKFLMARYLKYPESESRKMLVHELLKRQVQIEKELERLAKLAKKTNRPEIQFSW